jgi:hypothetical protein
MRVCVWPFYPPHHLSARGLKAVKQRPSSITAFRQSGLALISNHRTYTHTDKVPWDGVIKRGGGVRGGGSRVSIKVVTKTCTVYLLFPENLYVVIQLSGGFIICRNNQLANVFFRFRLIVS